MIAPRVFRAVEIDEKARIRRSSIIWQMHADVRTPPTEIYRYFLIAIYGSGDGGNALFGHSPP